MQKKNRNFSNTYRGAKVRVCAAAGLKVVYSQGLNVAQDGLTSGQFWLQKQQMVRRNMAQHMGM